MPNCITMEVVTGDKPFESWYNRIEKGTARIEGGVEDWRAANKNGGGHH